MLFPITVFSATSPPEHCRKKSAAHPTLRNVAGKNRQLIRPSGTLPTKTGSSPDPQECCRQKPAAQPTLRNVAGKNRHLILPSGMSPTEIGSLSDPPASQKHKMPVYPVDFGYRFIYSFFKAGLCADRSLLLPRKTTC